MKLLNKLIQEMCPNGVEYITLGKSCQIQKGIQLNKELLSESGLYPVINGGILPSGYWSKCNFNENMITISQGGASAGYVNFITSKFWAGAHCYILTNPIQKINYKYLYHIMKKYQPTLMNSQVGAGIPSVAIKTISNLIIPLPPLPVQAEIVRILDNFTELAAELTAELAARKKQYEYYRDELLNFRDDVSTVMLGDVGDVTKLAGFEFTSHVKYKDEGTIVALRGLNVKDGKLDLSSVKYIDDSNFEKLNRSKLIKGDMLFTYVGTIGQVAVIDEDDRFYLAPNVARIRFDTDIINPNFMRFYFQASHFFSKQISRFLNSSSMKNLTMENIRKFIIPLPPIEVQNNLVKLLLHFDKLCNDISEGLPAEIAARQKQYEYYRDRLLSFKEKTS